MAVLRKYLEQDRTRKWYYLHVGYQYQGIRWFISKLSCDCGICGYDEMTNFVTNDLEINCRLIIKFAKFPS